VKACVHAILKFVVAHGISSPHGVDSSTVSQFRRHWKRY